MNNKEVKKINDAFPFSDLGSIFFKIGLSGIKSFLFALSQIVWMFTGILMFGAVILYLIKSGDIKTMTEIPVGLGYLLDIFKNYWNYFFIGIWVFDFIINYRDINQESKSNNVKRLSK